MLTKRTNILFSESTWKCLEELSAKTSTSVGELVRDAVQEVYFSNSKSDEKKRAYSAIVHMRPVIRGKIDYKTLINEGRKY